MLKDEQDFSYNGGGVSRPLKPWSEFLTGQYIQKAKNIVKQFRYKNPDTFKKVRQFSLRFIYKKLHTLRYAIFMKILNLAFIYKKHDTLRYVTFLYTKSWTLRKKQDNLPYVFIYKNLNTLRYAIFH